MKRIHVIPIRLIGGLFLRRRQLLNLDIVVERRMNVMLLWRDRQGKTSLRKNLSSVAWSTTNPTWTSLKSNPCLRNYRPANYHLNHEVHVGLWIQYNDLVIAQIKCSCTTRWPTKTTVERMYRFLANKINRCTEFQFYWYYYSTCFGQPFCPSSGVLSRTSALVHFM
jgi:hypothetical protein